jgi:hypothetical protein
VLVVRRRSRGNMAEKKDAPRRASPQPRKVKSASEASQKILEVGACLHCLRPSPGPTLGTSPTSAPPPSKGRGPSGASVSTDAGTDFRAFDGTDFGPSFKTTVLTYTKPWRGGRRGTQEGSKEGSKQGKTVEKKPFRAARPPPKP